ncbi:MAG TPA: hypothetical protein VK663_07360 [Burkholderiales bacterium]|nr:hypothetical protein [Burkholderiales bacterium]
MRAIGDTIAFCPPQVIRDAEIEAMLWRFTKVLDLRLPGWQELTANY